MHLLHRSPNTSVNIRPLAFAEALEGNQAKFALPNVHIMSAVIVSSRYKLIDVYHNANEKE